MKSPFENLREQAREQQQREADMATRRQSPALRGDSLPRSVIRGESLQPPHIYRPESHPFAAITDWLCCTFPLKDDHLHIGGFINNLEIALGARFGSMVSLNKGLHGWRRSYKIGSTRAIFAIGGQRGRAYLQIPGEACALISMNGWHKLKTLMTSIYEGKITRWDGAADDHLGIHDLEWAMNQYRNGGFSTGGNKPKLDQRGNWDSEYEPDGRTIYVGKRKNGKLLRVYEKGKQLGDPFSAWVRWEIELRNKDREIPWDVLINPGPYVAGAHKCMHWINKETDRIATYKKATEISQAAMIAHCKNAYGPLFNHLLEQYDPSEILMLVKRSGKPKRLASPPPPD